MIMFYDYKKMYLRLFNAITDALKLLEEESKAAEILKTAQIDCEEMFMDDRFDGE